MGSNRPLVVALHDPIATDPDLTGAKAANLARSAAHGLPTMAGFAITTEATERGLDDPAVTEAIDRAHRALVAEVGDTPLVVRSSSTIEDAGASSMAGQFTSVLDVVGAAGLRTAAGEVVASADAVRDRDGVARPIAVLVQEQLDAPLGGVMFGVDPVTGNRDRIVVEAVPSRPDTLVGGEVTAAHYVLDRRGRIHDQVHASEDTRLPPALCKDLVALAELGAQVFGGPQDMEWALDRRGQLVLLQSRPVTAVAPHGGGGHVFGPGPVAETFPVPLTRLEVDLFAKPLRNGIVRALQVTGAATDHQLAASPVLTTLDGRVAVDLELLGITSGHRSMRNWINPAVLLRRLGAAWRVGRARIALPALASDVVATIDDHLRAIGPLQDIPSSALADLLDATTVELETAHAYEILAGMLLAPTVGAPSGSAVALAALAAGRADGLGDEQIVATHPEVLALVAPSIAAPPPLPPATSIAGPRPEVDDLALREALRLRCRWLQELEVRIARELGHRLADEAAIADPPVIAHLTRAELTTALAERVVPGDLAERASAASPGPLPDAFRLSSSGAVVPARHRRRGSASGVPAGGGRIEGIARHRVDVGSPRSGAILVTRHLEPQLAPLLPSLDGVVAETGSALSHLAILAREVGVPTVVGVADAVVRFPPGTRLVIDGTSGEVVVLEEATT
jgi:pyruvate,water dikinase